jgi:hypothetical protein
MRLVVAIAVAIVAVLVVDKGIIARLVGTVKAFAVGASSQNFRRGR